MRIVTIHLQYFICEAVPLDELDEPRPDPIDEIREALPGFHKWGEELAPIRRYSEPRMEIGEAPDQTDRVAALEQRLKAVEDIVYPAGVRGGNPCLTLADRVTLLERAIRRSWSPPR